MDRRCLMINQMPMNNQQATGNAALVVLARDGARGLTFKALGDELRLTAPAVRGWFGDLPAMRAAVATELGRRWNYWLRNDWRVPEGSDVDGPGPQWLLPLSPIEVASTRAWLALVQMAQEDEVTGRALAPHLADELASVKWRTRRAVEMSPDQLELVLAVVRGLRHRVCQHHEPMELQVAREHLMSLLALLAPSAAPGSTMTP